MKTAVLILLTCRVKESEVRSGERVKCASPYAPVSSPFIGSVTSVAMGLSTTSWPPLKSALRRIERASALTAHVPAARPRAPTDIILCMAIPPLSGGVVGRRARGWRGGGGARAGGGGPAGGGGGGARGRGGK